MFWRPDVLHHVLFAPERAVVTPYTFATIFLPTIFTYYVMAVLVQLPRTGLHRAALLPVVFWMTLRANVSLDFSWNHPGYDHLNQQLASGMFVIAMRCTAWVFAQRPYARLPICKTGREAENAPIIDHDGNTATEDGVSISSAMWNACDLVANFRLVGWNEPRQKHIPTSYFRVESRLLFVVLSFCRLVFLVLVTDILRRIALSFGDTFGTPKGGTIFDLSLPPLERYMRSSIITTLVALIAYVIMQANYQWYAVLSTVLFRQYPSQWPPLFDSPWLSTSLASFWGRRWHQCFREPFTVLGYFFGRFFGPVGTFMGAFAISGLLHDVGLRGMGRGGDTIPVMGFFLLHGVGVATEYAWRRATGKPVGGIIGWLWTASFLILSGNIIADAWARRGILGSECLPEAYSPTRVVLDWISRRDESM